MYTTLLFGLLHNTVGSVSRARNDLNLNLKDFCIKIVILNNREVMDDNCGYECGF